MNNSIFKSVLIGLLLGLLAFVAGRFLLVALIIGAILKLAGKDVWNKQGRRGHAGQGERKLAFANKVRSMTEEEYEFFKTKMGNQTEGPTNQENK